MKHVRLVAVAVSLAVVGMLASGARTQGSARSGFDSSRAYQDLRQIVGFGPRPAGSPALDATRRYLHRQLEASGVRVSDQAFEASTPIGAVHMVNVIGTIPGTRPDRIVLAGHFDTKLFRDFRFVGANDGGSSAAFLVEMARVLKARRNPFTMEVLFLDGEEAFHPTEWSGTDHTYGSRYYVEAARKSGTLGSLRALILVDMIGNRNITLKREGNSTPWLTDLIWQAARKIGLQQQFVDQTTTIEDDHMPFLQAGVAATDLIDLDGFSQYWHTSEDTLDKVSARSLQVVGDTVLTALPSIETRLAKPAKMKTNATTRGGRS